MTVTQNIDNIGKYAPLTPPVTMRTWIEIQHHQPSRPYLGLPPHVEAAGVLEPVVDVVGQLPDGYLATEVGVFGDLGFI